MDKNGRGIMLLFAAQCTAFLRAPYWYCDRTMSLPDCCLSKSKRMESSRVGPSATHSV
jgi:hypothetical protein